VRRTPHPACNLYSSMNGSMVKTSSWKSKSRSPSQEISLFMEPQDSLLCSQEPATGSYSDGKNPVHTVTPCFFKNDFNIILSSTPRFIPSCPTKMYALLITPTHATFLVQLILLDFITLMLSYLVKSWNNKSPHYTVSSVFSYFLFVKSKYCH
jgi:hypothetical protein